MSWPSGHGAEELGGPAVRIGALAPLTSPGWSEAGRHLLAGMELAVWHVNAVGGLGGRPFELAVRDTAANPSKAAAAVDELVDLGVMAIAGEYHSIAARAAAGRADDLGVPFLCSSAVMDVLTEAPTDWVARLSPAQSRGWRVYADFLLERGHRRIAVAAQESAYWQAGIGILRHCLAPRGGTVVELDVGASICDRLVESRVTALLILAGYPEPAASIVRAVRSDGRAADVLLGAPAGQPEFAQWSAQLGDSGTGIPFLRYLPKRLTALGAQVQKALRERLGEEPSFVAFEGYDTIAVLAGMLRAEGALEAHADGGWSRVEVAGTRGEIRFSRTEGASAWQWASAPVQVVERVPGPSGRFKVLHAG